VGRAQAAFVKPSAESWELTGTHWYTFSPPVRNRAPWGVPECECRICSGEAVGELALKGNVTAIRAPAESSS
jgi:hypothetical protein